MTVGLDQRRSSFRLLAATLVVALGAALFPVASFAQSAELLMFEERGCPWCRRWRAEVGPGYPHSPEGKRAPLRVVDIAGSRPAGIELATAVRFSPTFVLVLDGREVGRITGYPGADFFWGQLEGLLKNTQLAPTAVQQQAGVDILNKTREAP